MSTGNLKRFTECTPSQVYFLVLSKLPIGHLIKKNDSSVFMTTVESGFFAGQCSWIISILMVRCGAISWITDFVALQCKEDSDFVLYFHSFI